jgi:HSP20 family protein
MPSRYVALIPSLFTVFCFLLPREKIKYGSKGCQAGGTPRVSGLDNCSTVANFTAKSAYKNTGGTLMAEWNPVDEMAALRREIDRAFEGFGFGQQPSQQVAFLPGRGPRRYPLINLLEDKDNVYIEALTPGVDPQSLDLSLMQNRLTLSGEKSRISGDIKPEAFHRSERASGKFVRTIDLPVEVNEQAIQAEYKNGLLLVTLPKAEKAKPKQISVKLA